LSQQVALPMLIATEPPHQGYSSCPQQCVRLQCRSGDSHHPD